MNKFRHHSRGLVLVEVAIAMIIFSLCIGGVLMMMRFNQSAHQNNITQSNRSTIFHALNRFHRQEGYIPCPSQPVLDEGFALTRCQGSQQQIGLVPYKTLGLPASVAKDGHGNYFTYAVSESATLPETELGTSLTNTNLRVIDMAGRAYGNKSNGIAFLVISHGVAGKGAFSLQQRNRFPTRTSYEAENAKDTLTFYADVPFSESDHTVFFMQRADLVFPAKPSQGTPTAHQAPISEEDPYGTEISAAEE